MIKLTRALAAVALVFFIIATFVGVITTEPWGFSGFSNYTWIWTICLAIVIPSAIVVFWNKEFDEGKISKSLFFYLSLLLATGVIFGFILATFDAEIRTSIAILGSTVLATMGWMLQYHNSKALQKEQFEASNALSIRQYTLERIQEYRADREYGQHKNNIRRHYSGLKSMEEITALAELYEAYTDNKSYESKAGTELPIASLPVIVSINEIMNFHEEIAYGIRNKEMDEDVIWNTLGDIVLNSYQKYLQHIIFSWRQDFETWEHYRWLINKWTWEIKQKQRHGMEHFKPFAPEKWSNQVWIVGNKIVPWGEEGNGPWGRNEVDSWLLEKANET